MQIDLHVHDADVLTLDGHGMGSRARGLAIHDGRVLAVLDELPQTYEANVPLRDYATAVDGHRMEIAVEADNITVDPVLFEQVLVNLLDNAAKYAPAGSEIAVRARIDGGEAVIAVEDQGPGIPAHERERVFDMFYRVNAADSGRPEPSAMENTTSAAAATSHSRAHPPARCTAA